MKNIFKDRRLVVSVIAVIAALLIFQTGVFIGYHKALFSYRGGDRYFRMIDGSRGPGMMSDDFSPSHGAIGRIVSVSLPSFIVAGPDNSEKTVMLGHDTVIRLFRNTASTTAIRADQFAIVLGEPNDAGVIEARFVRIMPPPATTTSPNR